MFTKILKTKQHTRNALSERIRNDFDPEDAIGENAGIEGEGKVGIGARDGGGGGRSTWRQVGGHDRCRGEDVH
ncbi:hypothetical protein TIFTF001_003393 [Ficus carica]|uniref:Uncharacterized protein n=1 Tax=Ficus carica TaxID=3494 RepID=A0AA87ZB97_FICCA|nr:hypothetical protein TIFTF001_003393 [Ficus carica]